MRPSIGTSSDSVLVDIEVSITENFEKQVAHTPEKIAVVCNSNSMNYKDLLERSKEIATEVERKKVTRGKPVAILMEKNNELVATILAVLRCGLIYVPIDTAYPFARIAYILNELKSPLLLTDRQNAPVVNQLVEEKNNVCIVDNIAIDSTGHVAVSVASGEKACVIYTSGSSGDPKGVVHSHRNVLHLVRQQIIDFSISHNDSVSLIGSLCHISGLSDLFRALLCGASLHLYDIKKSGLAQLVEWIENERISVFHSVPTVFRYMTAAIKDKRKVQSLRLIHLGGERVMKNDLASFKETYSGSCLLVNNLGCSELSSFRHFFVSKSTVVNSELVPVGYPVEDKTVLLLDKDLSMVPVGEVGEIYLQSEYLAGEYWCRPDLTQEAFISRHPYGTTRLYKTGDLGRFDEEGCLYYLGRHDKQIEIRGYRVEPAEIEECLLSHPSVKYAAAYPAEQGGETRINACVVLNNRNSPIIDGKRRYLLPNGMMLVHQNKAETDHLYESCFDYQTYLNRGIYIKKGDVVVDVGANIGMFTLFASNLYDDVKVYSFEPIPDIYSDLKTNCELYAKGAKTFNYGISDQNRTVNFNFFPLQSTMSCQLSHSQEKIDSVLLEKHIEVSAKSLGKEYDAILREKKALAVRKMRGVVRECTLRTLSHAIGAEDITRINLLKIDAQRAEYDVIKGVTAKHWQRIEQVVMEVHDEPGTDNEGNLEEIALLLKSENFDVTVEQEKDRQGTGRYLLFARKNSYLKIKEKDFEQAKRTKTIETSIGTEEELRSHCSLKLPSYMVPSNVMILDRIPLSSSGKILLNKLPSTDNLARKELRNPENDLESLLVDMWSDLLDISPIGTDDDFFSLGGHSLLAVTFTQQLEDAYNVKLDLATLFKAPTISKLASYISAIKQGETGNILTQLCSSETERKLFLIHTLGGQIIGYADLVKNLKSDFNVYGIFSSGLLENCTPQNNIKEMASLYIKQIRSVQPEGPYILGGACFAGYVAYEICQQLINSGEKVKLMFMIDTRNPKKYIQHVFEGYRKAQKAQRGFKDNVLRVLHRKATGLKAAMLERNNSADELISKEEQVLRSNRVARDSYKPTPLNVNTCFFWSTNSDKKEVFNPDHGWMTLIDGEFTLERLLCRHQMILEEPMARQIADRIIAVLKEEN